MTLQQQAYNRIDRMSDEGIQFVIDMIDKMETVSLRGFIDKYDNQRETVSGVDKITVDTTSENEIDFSAKLKNLKLLEEIKESADPQEEDYVSDLVISNVYTVLVNISRQPVLFRTHRNSMQMEYELDDKSYLEFEVYEDHISCMRIPKGISENASFPKIKLNDVHEMSKIVDDFFKSV